MLSRWALGNSTLTPAAIRPAVMVGLYLQLPGLDFAPPTAAACLQPRRVLEVGPPSTPEQQHVCDGRRYTPM
jgi:hypothetical protein